MGLQGWAAVVDRLDGLTSFMSLNGHGCYRDICTCNSDLKELKLAETELGFAMTRYLERNAKTLTTLDLRYTSPLASHSGTAIRLVLNTTSLNYLSGNFRTWRLF